MTYIFSSLFKIHAKVIPQGMKKLHGLIKIIVTDFFAQPVNQFLGAVFPDG
jgi:hypothetical protein